MITPLTVSRDTTVLLEPRYFGSIGWYAALAASEYAIVDFTSRYDKRRKLTHRTTIADVNGPLDLTVPISRPPLTDPGRPLTWSDMLVSTHDQWWNIHRVTLESAYGRTPFFEFYIDRFLPALTAGVVDRFPTLRELDTFIDRQIRSILGLPECQAVSRPIGSVIDLRRQEPMPLRAGTEWPPYYQVRAARHGFLPGLSIMDLIFNVGPESPLYLRKVLATD
ncbi:MAG: WbqC family protein [Muribaculaceae bacterium]|nr:WbqC family protein [Muribaculaceae bacterium]